MNRNRLLLRKKRRKTRITIQNRRRERMLDGETEGSLSPPSGSSSIFGGSQGADAATDEALSTLLSSLPFPSGNGSWSAYVCNLEENTEGMLNEHRMQAASLIKLYIRAPFMRSMTVLPLSTEEKAWMQISGL